MTIPRTADAKPLIDAIRNRLWFQRTVDVVAASLRICGGISLAGGLFHVFIHAASTEFVVIMAVMPIVGALLAVMFRHRPDLATAARTADIWFDGKNLMTSAWDLFQRHDGHSSMEELVMARAREVAPQWRERIASVRPIRYSHPITMPLILILCGIFLLQLPSKEWLTRFQSGTNGRVFYHDRDPVNASGETVPPISESVSAHGTSETGRASSPSFSPESSLGTSVDPSVPGTRRPGQAESDPGIAIRDAVHPFGGGADGHRSATSNERGESAGDPGITGENGGSGVESAKLKVKEIVIRRKANGPDADDTGHELAQEVVTGTQGSAVTAAVPPAQHAHTTFRGIYTPALRAYMSRYMQELNTQRVQRP